MSSDRREGPAQLAHPTEFDEVFGRRYPNPDRVGCPPREVLISLARRERPIGDPAYDHIKECSPCYLEGRAIQEADALHRRRRILTWAAAAILALAAGSGAWMLTRGSGAFAASGFFWRRIKASIALRPGAAPCVPYDPRALARSPTVSWIGHATLYADETIGRALNVFEQVNRDIPLKGLHWFFDHAETISDRNLERVKALGGGIAIQHRMAYQGEAFAARYGKKAAEHSPPVRKSDSDSSIHCFGFRVFSINWEICFSIRACYWHSSAHHVLLLRCAACRPIFL